MKIRKGDNIKIMVGKDKGKTGKVLTAFPHKGKVVIEGLNLYKKHVRPKTREEKGQIVSVPRAINVSNVMLVCSTCTKPVRVGMRVEGEMKTRYCKKCGTTIK